jgi:hypothetical protein
MQSARLDHSTHPNELKGTQGSATLPKARRVARLFVSQADIGFYILPRLQ